MEFFALLQQGRQNITKLTRMPDARWGTSEKITLQTKGAAQKALYILAII